jgi:hypothetical protein
MEYLFLLLSIVFLIGVLMATIQLSRLYAAFRVNAFLSLREIREHLLEHKEDLRSINLEYSQKYSTQDSEPYGSRALKYQDALKSAHDYIFLNLQEYKTILIEVPKAVRNPLEVYLRLISWNKTTRKLNMLYGAIPQFETYLRNIAYVLAELDNLPSEIADLAKSTRNLSWETKTLINELGNDAHVSGKTMEESTNLVGEIEKELSEINTIFYTLPPAKLNSSPNIKFETQKVYRTIQPIKKRLDKLFKDAKTWKEKVELLQKTFVSIEEKLAEADSMFSALDKYLIISSENEELLSLHEKVEIIKGNIDNLTIENLISTLEDAGQTLAGLKNLILVFSDYSDKLNQLEILTVKIENQVGKSESLMRLSSTHKDFPIEWTSSKAALEQLRSEFAKIPSLATQKRTPVALYDNLVLSKTCSLSSSKLLETVSKVINDLEQFRKLWQPLKTAYTLNWLTGVQDLFSKIDIYDIEKNWDSKDHASSLLIDANVMMEKARKNIPLASSVPIYEEQVVSMLIAAKELAEQKPVFDERRNRIQTQLSKIQKDEEKAIEIFNRVSLAVISFSKDVRYLSLSTTPAQNILTAEKKAYELQQSLDQRKSGTVSKKLEQVKKWEKTSSENARIIYKWIDNDLLRQRTQLAQSLKIMKKFALDLEDKVVIRAHRYELKYNTNQLDTSWIETEPIETLQKRSAKLIRTRQNVITTHNSLENFIAPIMRDYEKLDHSLKRLKADCSKLENDFRRGWPPVFQSIQIIEKRIASLDRDMTDVRKLSWKRSELLKNYYHFRTKIREIWVELELIKELDKKESLEIKELEKDYKRLVIEHANKLYDDDSENIQKAINAGDAHIRFLRNKYKTGEYSATEIKAKLENRVQTVTNQIININNSKFRDVTIKQKMK